MHACIYLYVYVGMYICMHVLMQTKTIEKKNRLKTTTATTRDNDFGQRDQ